MKYIVNGQHIFRPFSKNFANLVLKGIYGIIIYLNIFSIWNRKKRRFLNDPIPNACPTWWLLETACRENQKELHLFDRPSAVNQFPNRPDYQRPKVPCMARLWAHLKGQWIPPSTYMESQKEFVLFVEILQVISKAWNCIKSNSSVSKTHGKKFWLLQALINIMHIFLFEIAINGKIRISFAIGTQWVEKIAKKLHFLRKKYKWYVGKRPN